MATANSPDGFNIQYSNLITQLLGHKDEIVKANSEVVIHSSGEQFIKEF